ncbi:PIN domain-containing protein [Candidatus Woesearchaeota archaeon]|nr:PIN domain-containing protein [Candidatus Woesearchaeota archaeon]
MALKYYIDSSIWMDIYDDRTGYKGEPFAEYGLGLLAMILANKDTIVISDKVVDELRFFYTTEQLNGLFAPFENLMERVLTTKAQADEAEHLSSARKVPKGDAVHAVLARDHGLILVARDKHFRQLDDISQHHKPEELI